MEEFSTESRESGKLVRDSLEAPFSLTIDRPHAQADCSNNSDAVTTTTLLSI